MKLSRFMQIMLCSLFGLMGVFFTIGGLARGIPGLSVMGGFWLFLALVAALVFQWQISSARNAGARVRTNVEAIAAQLFDRPAQVAQGYDMTVTAGAGMGALLNVVDSSAQGFTTEGDYRGVRVAAASHVSIAGRQMMEMNHVYSYVLVDTQGAEVPFKLVNQSTLGRMMGVTSRDAQVGDAAFDQTFTVDTDDECARAVYDADVRARLMALKAQVANVSQDWGVGGMSILLTRKGLALRWPGDIDPALARYIRDLLLEMRTRLLAHLDRKARAGNAAAEGYRVASDVALGTAGAPGEPAEVSAAPGSVAARTAK
jgi:hypothetical protein